MLRLSTREDIQEALDTPQKRDKLLMGMATALAKESMRLHDLPSIDSVSELSEEEVSYYNDLALQALKYIAD